MYKTKILHFIFCAVLIILLSKTKLFAQQDSTSVQNADSIAVKAESVNDDAKKTDRQAHKDSLKASNRFFITAGAFFPLVNTKLRVDTKDGTVGTDISLEETFGLSQNPNVFKMDALFQLTKRSAFKGTFFNMNRKKTWVIDRDIKIADSVYYVGADIDFYFNTAYFALSYRYSVIAKKDWQLGLSFGLRWLDFKTGLRVVTDSLDKKVDYKIGVPAALFGVSVSGNILPRLTGRYDFDVLKLSVEGIDAIVYENRLSLEYYFTKNIGIGGAYNGVLYLAKDFPLTKNFNGEVRYMLNGLSAFAAVRF